MWDVNALDHVVAIGHRQDSLPFAIGVATARGHGHDLLVDGILREAMNMRDPVERITSEMALLESGLVLCRVDR